MVTRIGTPCAGGYSKLQFTKSNMVDGRHVEKSKIRHISATDWPILMKFSTVTQIWSLKRTTVKNLNFLKSKMAATAILEDGKIEISPQPFDRFSRNFTG